MADLKKGLDENKAELAVLRKELEAVKNQKSTLELVEKLQGHQKALEDSKELEHILVKYGNNPDGMSSLHYAIKVGDFNAVSLLIANGADVNSRNNIGHSGNIWNFTGLVIAVLYNQEDVARSLIALGADVKLTVTLVNHSVATKYDALYYAAQKGNSSIVNLLLENGANLDTDYGPGNLSPLHVASSSGNYDAVIALVRAGANINRISDVKTHGQMHWKDGTPLDYAANNLAYKESPQSLDLIKFLVENGGNRLRICDVPCPVISGYLKSVGK